MEDDLRWDPPGPGIWFASTEHMPAPVSGLMAELLPQASAGWRRGTDRYGLPPNNGTFGVVNCWGVYSPGGRGEVDLDELERRAAESLALPRWRARLAEWHEVRRPAVLARNRELLTVDLAELDDEALAAHVQATVDHFVEHGPQHFESFTDGSAALGALLLAVPTWGLDPPDVLAALAGTSSASSSAERVVDRIAHGLREAGVDAPADLDEVRALGGDAAAALDELLVDYGWRTFDADPVQPTLAERPDAILVSVRAALHRWGGRQGPDAGGLDALRDQVPETDRARFDELAADARIAYGHNDDNTVLLFSVPMGAIRRATLEVGHRLVARGRLHTADDAFDAQSHELVELLRGGGPSADVLADRRRFREAMADVPPPGPMGAPVPEEPVEWPPSVRALQEVFDAFVSIAWARPAPTGRAQVSLGTEVVRGRAVVVDGDPSDALARMEPGDVLVAQTTSAPFNTIFPVAGAVAVQVGSVMSHAALLARELGLTAVIGVPDLLARVADGDLVEVDPGAGTIQVVGRAGSPSR